ncbi:MAG: hypothetical protein ACJ0DF_08225 [Paracoccaceae bacterium]
MHEQWNGCSWTDSLQNWLTRQDSLTRELLDLQARLPYAAMEVKRPGPSSVNSNESWDGSSATGTTDSG